MGTSVLELLGLDRRTESVYRLMLEEPRLGVAELCQRLALSEPDLRDALDELTRHSLLTESGGAASRLRPIRPAIGLELVLLHQEQDLAARLRDLAAVRAQLAELVAGRAEPDEPAPVTAIRRLSGGDALRAELESLVRHASAEWLTVLPRCGHPAGHLGRARALQDAALARGVRVLSLCADAARGNPDSRAYARWLTGLAGQVRTATVIPPSISIVDGRTAILPIDPSRPGQGGVCTTEPGIVRTAMAVFEQAWLAALPLSEKAAADQQDEVSPPDRQLLRLLARGLTDEAAGFRLGVSARTVRRQMAALMERLDATSRFEAGIKAARRGWI
jgi:DNA-binding CsgD family transcriptional regulator